MKEMMMKENPILLEKTVFLPKNPSFSFSFLLEDWCQAESIVLQLSMRSQLLGTQVLLLLNHWFGKDANIEAVAAPAMM